MSRSRFVLKSWGKKILIFMNYWEAFCTYLPRQRHEINEKFDENMPLMFQLKSEAKSLKKFEFFFE